MSHTRYVQKFDDVIAGQANGHNYMTTCANQVLPFSKSSLICILNDIVAAFCLATVSAESTIILFSHTRYVQKFDDVVSGQAYGHNSMTTCANSVLSFSKSSLICILNDIVAAFCLATVPVESTIFYSVT